MDDVEITAAVEEGIFGDRARIISGVVAVAAVDDVVAAAAGQFVVAIVAGQMVVAGAARDRVIAVAAGNDVVAAVAAERIVAIAAVDHVVVVAAGHSVVAIAARDGVVAGAARDGVVAVAAAQRVPAVTAGIGCHVHLSIICRRGWQSTGTKTRNRDCAFSVSCQRSPVILIYDQSPIPSCRGKILSARDSLSIPGQGDPAMTSSL